MHYVLVVYMIPIIAVISTKVVGGGDFFLVHLVHQRCAYCGTADLKLTSLSVMWAI